MKLFNILKNLTKYRSFTWTPTFTWANGDTAPTVANISCQYIKLGAMYYFMGRFNITAKNTTATNTVLVMSMPFKIAHVSPQTIGQVYSADANYAKPLLLRTSSSRQTVSVVSGIGGDNSSGVLATGYYGFNFVWFKYQS